MKKKRISAKKLQKLKPEKKCKVCIRIIKGNVKYVEDGKWISNKIPKHHSYIEPYFGSGAVFFAKEPSAIETINDLDDDVINLFNCIRNRPEELASTVYYTPYSRSTYDL